MNLGPTIKFLRTSRGLKQSELATALEVSENYVSLIERERREPSLDFLNRLSKYLDVPIGLFFAGSASAEIAGGRDVRLAEIERQLHSLLVNLAAVLSDEAPKKHAPKKPS